MQCLYLCVFTMCGMAKAWYLMFVSFCVYNVFCDVHYLMCICDCVWQWLLFGLHSHSYAFTMNVDDMLSMYFEMCVNFLQHIVWFSVYINFVCFDIYDLLCMMIKIWYAMFVCIYNFVCVIRNLMGCLYVCVFAMLSCLNVCVFVMFVMFVYLLCVCIVFVLTILFVMIKTWFVLLIICNAFDVWIFVYL